MAGLKKAGKIKVYQGNKELKNFFSNYKSGEIGDVYSIIGDARGNVWLGTKGDGLYKATPINAQNSQYVLKTIQGGQKTIPRASAATKFIPFWKTRKDEFGWAPMKMESIY